MKRRGFTLIEILIVLIIIGILATLIIPQIGGMIERARVAEARIAIGAIKTLLMANYLELEMAGATPRFPDTPATVTTAGLEARLGEVAPDTARFNYYYLTDNAATPKKCTIYAERNSNDWSGGTRAHSCVKFIIYGDQKSSAMGTGYVGSGTAPTDITGVVLTASINGVLADVDINDPY